jgi:NNMT/PNMT/TEMT family
MTIVSQNAATKGTQDFKLFSPPAYLDAYYSNWDVEDDFHMTFLHAAYKSIPKQEKLLEIGGGPAIHQLVSARHKVERITFGEYLSANRHEILKWKKGDATAFNWDPYFEYAARLENSNESIADMKQTLRSKLRNIVPCDILRQPPMLRHSNRLYDIVSVHFCAESITSKREEFHTAMSNILSFLNPGGYLVISFLRAAGMYPVGTERFCAYPVCEDEVTELLNAMSCKIEMIDNCAANDRDYWGVFSLVARKQPR